ncbi:MAG: TlyA family RNA methyltransferase [Defluviitaleaceae bacterium]|nr:TlyA family RNA methyltransferase [Defluviitaleaceae bacterium]
MYRLDIVTAQKLGISRHKAKDLIQRGEVQVDGNILTKPSFIVNEDVLIETAGLKYVSRGGYKLEHALETFNFKPYGVCVDIGASTGGFTDCLLQNGAEYVYAVDVGTNQLAEKLKNDERVGSFENTHIKNFSLDFLSDIVTIDVSFISLEQVLPIAYSLLKEGGFCIVLIKPQFELGKKGRVTKKNHKPILLKIKRLLVQLGFELRNETAYGDEYFYLLRKTNKRRA